MNAWIVGATGLVGGALLDLLLAEPRVETITAIVRRPVERAHPKLNVLVSAFDDLEATLRALPPVPGETQAFCCLGTTIKKAGSEAAFRHVDHDLPLAFGRAAAAATARRFLIVTALGADPGSRIFYNRVKGEVEADLRALGLRELHLFRPSLMLGPRAERRPAEALGMALAKPLGALMVGPLARYRAIEGADVARAMLAVALDDRAGDPVTIHESDTIPRLARGE